MRLWTVFWKRQLCVRDWSTRQYFQEKKETAKAFAKKHGAEFIYTDLKELAESSDIDAVYIASPNSCHCEQAVEMLKHGKHVLCEKPAASNAAELQRMRAAAENGQAVLLEAMRSVYDPGFRQLKQICIALENPECELSILSVFVAL